MAGQIKISLTEIEKTEKKLLALQNKIANRKVNVNFANTKGNMAEEIENAVLELNEAGMALSALIGQTEKVVQNAKDSFSSADAESAKLFG